MSALKSKVSRLLVFFLLFLYAGSLSSKPLDCRWDLLSGAPTTWSIATVVEGEITKTEKALIEAQVKSILPFVRGWSSTLRPRAWELPLPSLARV